MAGFAKAKAKAKASHTHNSQPTTHISHLTSHICHLASVINLFPLIPRPLLKPHQIKHTPHSAAHTRAVGGFYLIGIEVGGEVGKAAVADVEVVAGEEDFSHHVTFVSEILQVLFCAQIIKAEGLRLMALGAVATVTLDDFVAIFDELKADLTARLHDMSLRWRSEVTHQMHQGCLTAAYRSG